MPTIFVLARSWKLLVWDRLQPENIYFHKPGVLTHNSLPGPEARARPVYLEMLAVTRTADPFAPLRDDNEEEPYPHLEVNGV